MRSGQGRAAESGGSGCWLISSCPGPTRAERLRRMTNTKTPCPALLDEIMQVIDADVRPALRRHGGDITNVYLDGQVLHFRLVGNCSGCPSAWLTGEELLRGPLMERFPVLTDVVADIGLDDEMIRLAKEVLAGRDPFAGQKT